MDQGEWARPDPTDFDNFVPWACNQLSVESNVVVTRVAMSEYVSVVVSDRPEKSKKARKSKTPSPIGSNHSSEYAMGTSIDDNVGDKPIRIHTVYDQSMHLVHIKFLKNESIPQEVIKIIALVIPMHKHLISITIDSGLRVHTIYEIAKILPTSTITEMCLDFTDVPEANYHLLLNHNSLKLLSLAKCNLNDDVVQTIAEKLVLPSPAAKSLTILNLATNFITDLGAKYLAKALRSNRRLGYLNISDNLITDKGAGYIFDILVEFPLTGQEYVDKKARYAVYLKEKLDLVYTTIKDIKIMEREKKVAKRRGVRSAISSTTKRKTGKDTSKADMTAKSRLNLEHAVRDKADEIVEEMVGPYRDPFDRNNTITRDGVVYCFGNNSLCYLNIAYNNLSLMSVEKLRDVLVTQTLWNRSPRGLINVRIDGNYLPSWCPLLEEIDEILESQLPTVRKQSVPNKKKSARSAVSRNINSS
ncbi:leucine-rich repeat-containing protein 71-like [Helicoverpa zea]|uniref:leucine-rich repeat-containing protein 71-like n=1 Tax=Helicoverpa zea TaxID=7113 RepID=UPI001F58CE22|nr:leucine-rich repeat-containing protein 71-like [Helicoverpa zea]